MQIFSEFKDPAFEGKEEISVDDLRKVVVRSFEEAPDLMYENWDGTPVVFCGLTLSHGNSIIKEAAPVTMGEIPGQIFPAVNLWDLEEEIYLRFEAINLTKFIFKDIMISELVDHTDIKYSVVNKNDVVVPDEDLKSLGFPGFSLRLFLEPLNVTTIKLSVLCYPLNLNELKKSHPQIENPSFPGTLLHQMSVVLGVTTSDLINTKFGSPILPIIKLSKPLADKDRIPSSRDITAALSVTFRSVTVPEMKSDVESLLARWEEIKEKGVGSIRELKPDNIWPYVVQSTGEIYFKCILALTLFLQEGGGEEASNDPLLYFF